MARLSAARHGLRVRVNPAIKLTGALNQWLHHANMEAAINLNSEGIREIIMRLRVALAVFWTS